MVENNGGDNIVKLVEAAIPNGDQATIERVVNRSRWCMDEEAVSGETAVGSPSVTGGLTETDPVTPEVASLKPQVEVVTVYKDGNQPTIVFKPGVDFHNGGSIPF